MKQWEPSMGLELVKQDPTATSQTSYPLRHAASLDTFILLILFHHMDNVLVVLFNYLNLILYLKLLCWTRRMVHRFNLYAFNPLNYVTPMSIGEVVYNIAALSCLLLFSRNHNVHLLDIAFCWYMMGFLV